MALRATHVQEMPDHLVRGGAAEGLADGGAPFACIWAELHERAFRRLGGAPKVIVLIETWRCHYNGVRPHSSLAYQTPLAFKKQFEEKNSKTSKEAILQN